MKFDLNTTKKTAYNSSKPFSIWDLRLLDPYQGSVMDLMEALRHTLPFKAGYAIRYSKKTSENIRNSIFIIYIQLIHKKHVKLL